MTGLVEQPMTRFPVPRGELTQLTQLPEGAGHLYLSCACLHGLHDRCGRMQHDRGEAGSPHCKFCPAICLCPVCRHPGSPADAAGPDVPGPVVRAYYRRYRAVGDRRAKRVTRVHVIRDNGKHPGTQGLCGAGAGAQTESYAVILDPMPAIAPAGLTWCGRCVGLLAERAGLVDSFASILAASRPAVV